MPVPEYTVGLAVFNFRPASSSGLAARSSISAERCWPSADSTLIGANVSALAANPNKAAVAETTVRSLKCDQRKRFFCMPIPIFDCYDIFNNKYHSSIINQIEYEILQISRFSLWKMIQLGARGSAPAGKSAC